jgi:hypothetical protein
MPDMTITIKIHVSPDDAAYAECKTIYEMCAAELAAWIGNDLDDMVSGYTPASITVTPGHDEDTSAAEEAAYLDELNRGYAQDRI